MRINYNELILFYVYPSLVSLVITVLLLPFLFLLDFLALFIAENSLMLGSIFYSTSLLLICLLLVGVIFELIYFLSRWMAIAFSHLPRLFSILLPGFSLFLVTGWPLLDQPNFVYFLKEETALALIYLITPSFFVAIILMRYWPNFQGINSVLLVVASFCGLLFYELFSTSIANNNILFLFKLCVLIIVIFSIYINLHIRHKIELGLMLEYYKIPNKVIWIMIGLALFLFLIIVSAFTFNSRNTFDFEAIQLLLAVAFVFVIRWLFVAYFYQRHRLRAVDTMLFFSRRLSLFLFAFTVVSLAVFFPVYKIGSEHLNQLVHSRGASSSILTMTGLLLDLDSDNNSFWPGRDPNDEDACIRYDSSDICMQLQNENSPRFASYTFHQHGQVNPTRIGAHLDVLFVSIQMKEENKGNIQKSFDYLNFEHNLHTKSILLPELYSNDGFSGLLQGLNGFEILAGIENQSLVSQFTDFGYRTICFTNKNIKNPKNEVLFKGCQILEKNSLELKKIVELKKSYRKYREKKNLVWIHFELDKLNEIDLKPVKLIVQSLLKIPGNPIVMILPEDSVSAEIYSKKKFFKSSVNYQSFHEIMVLAAGGYSKNYAFPRVGILNKPNVLNKYADLKKTTSPRIFPRMHYYLFKDKIYFYDGITGSKHLPR